MLASAREAMGDARGRTRLDLDTDVVLARLLRSCVQDIGEAASKVSDPVRALSPSIPWGSIVMMRHVLVHVYWGVDKDALWQVIESDLEKLIGALEPLLATMESTS